MTLEKLLVRAVPGPNGCLNLGDPESKTPYWLVGHEGKWTRAHRVAWMLNHGAIPAGMKICHVCDNTRCVNVLHLFLGTQGDNIRDARNKGRLFNPKGQNHPRAQLTAAQVAGIRENAAAGASTKALAAQFGISIGQIRLIVRGLRWKPQQAA